MGDEKIVRVPGANGTLCSPACTSRACPTKVPDAVTGKPHCVLKVGATKRCALLCNKYSNCGKNASCKLVQGATGMCTYDDDAAGDGAEGAFEADELDIFVWMGLTCTTVGIHGGASVGSSFTGM